MATDKKGFVLYADQKDSFCDLTDEEAGILIKHIFAYVNDENPILSNRYAKIAFNPIKSQLKRDLVKYELVREKRSIAGKASAEAKKQTLTNSTHVESVEQTLTNSTVIVKDNVSVNVTVKDKVTVKDIINRDFISLEFLENFNKWIKYKSDRKEKYKSIESEKSFYNKLIKLSNNDPLIAFEIIEQSMANNWAGIFELKNNNQNGNKQTNPNERKANLNAISELTRNFLQQPFTIIDHNAGNSE